MDAIGWEAVVRSGGRSCCFFNNSADYQSDVSAVRAIGEIRTGDLGNIGSIYRNKGDLDEALENFEKALKIHRDIGYRRGEAEDLGNIGTVHMDRWSLDTALEYFEKALKIHREIGCKRGEANQLGNAGLVYMRKGVSCMEKGIPDEASEYLDKASKIFEEAYHIDGRLEYHQAAAFDLGNIGLVCMHKGELAEALKCFEDALQIFEKIGCPMGKAEQQRNMALVYCSKEESDRAFKLLTEALDTFKSINSHFQVLQTFSEFFRFFIKNKAPIKAFSSMKDALIYALDKKVDNPLSILLHTVKPLVEKNQWEYLEHACGVHSPEFDENLNSFFAAIAAHAKFRFSREKNHLDEYKMKRHQLDKSTGEILDDFLGITEEDASVIADDEAEGLA